jgi:hypothetical protein
MPIVVIILITSLACFIVWAFRALRSARNEVRTTWTTLENAIADRTPVVTRMIESLTPFVEPDVAKKLVTAHERMGHVVGPRGTDAADMTLRSILEPTLKSLPTQYGLDGLKLEITTANQKIDDASSLYNAKVELYEAERKSSGKALFAEFLGFEKESYFGKSRHADLLGGQPAFV